MSMQSTAVRLKKQVTTAAPCLRHLPWSEVKSPTPPPPPPPPQHPHRLKN